MLALVDCNSCYASCEQIFRPDLRGKPVVVLSNNDGCIIARSHEAKQLGIPDLDPYFKQEKLLNQHGVEVFSSNFRLYGDISQRVMQILRRFSPRVEQYSIDEMFLDFSGMPGDLEEYGVEIKETLWREVRMPVGVGIAPTKTLAKLTNLAAKKIKPSGVVMLDHPDKWQWLQRRLPVDKIWGVGKRLSQRLQRLGIYTILDLAQADPRHVASHTSVQVARTLRELNGIVSIELEEQPSPKKEIFVTRTFANKVNSLADLQEHISRYAVAATEKLRQQDGLCGAVHIFAHTSRFHPDYYSNSATLHLPYLCSDSRAIIKAAKEGMRRIFRPGTPFPKCGIGLLDLRRQRPHQYDLFAAGQSLRQEQTMQVLDQINRRYGRDSLVFASEGVEGRWTMRQQRLSPAYTTRWSDLPRVKC